MDLNEAYEALESMRRVNLELACSEYQGSGFQVDHNACSTCVLIEAKQLPDPSRKKKVLETRCLTCASPCCIGHSSEIFRKEGITLCKECEKVFHMEFIMNCMTLDESTRRERLYHLVDLFDRTVLLLRYSDQFIGDVANVLETNQARHNKFHVGGSSAGIVSGVLGVAAAFTILTPAGPPLLLASLLLGGTATAVQTGTDVRDDYFFEPSKVGDRVLALHGMLLSILTLTETLRDAAILDAQRTFLGTDHDHILADLHQDHVPARQFLLADAEISTQEVPSIKSHLRMDKTLLAAAAAAEVERAEAEKAAAERAEAERANGSNTSSLRATNASQRMKKSLQTVDMVTRNTRLMSRVSSGVMRSLRFARIAGGTMAGVSLLVDASSFTGTIRSIRAGNPCEKAIALRRIQSLIPNLPPTENLERECRAFLAYMKHAYPQQAMSEQYAAQLIVEVSTRESEDGQEESQQEEEEEDKEEKKEIDEDQKEIDEDQKEIDEDKEEKKEIDEGKEEKKEIDDAEKVGSSPMYGI